MDMKWMNGRNGVINGCNNKNVCTYNRVNNLKALAKQLKINIML
jgi:hypothetical protein